MIKRAVLNIRKRIRGIYLKRKRSGLVNKDFSLISSNCTGCMILHDLGLKFNSPFVNLWIAPSDYVKLLSNFKEYMQYRLEFIEEPGINYPVALLKDVKIFFQHYHSTEEAERKWNERASRIDYDNLFVLFTDRDGCTFENLAAFDALPYENKVVFVNKPYDNIKSSVYIKGFEKEKAVGSFTEFDGKISFKKHYDQFDYVSWFNKEVNV